ncbi:MAG: hypothetical protein B7733_13085 [Myxococcales bacterium FL481]|nr:MAG: hypothetical protein B7733_13085 [Myxococcales bacterium FL481]
MTTKVVFKRAEFESQMADILNDALTEAAAIGADGAQREIKARAPIAGRPIGRGGGAVSKAGESPTTQLGVLRNSVSFTEARALRAAVGSNLPYARFLELGTSTMQPRPWLKRGVIKSRDRMQRVFTAIARKGFERINLNARVA